MTPQERKNLILEYKSKNIEGMYIDFVAYSSQYSENIIYLRNQNKARYFLHQTEASTLENQNKWYESYKLRDNDIYWCILDKQTHFVGTVRLYDIDLNGTVCTHGSLIIDEAYAMGGPFAFEAMLMSLRFAFDTLEIESVLNDVRTDNKNMKSISKRLGFCFVKNYELRGITYILNKLKKEDFKPELLETALNRLRN